MEDVTYDQQKIALVVDITERSLEQRSHLDVIIERLTVLEGMHKKSPNIEAKMNLVIECSTKAVPQALLQEQEAASVTRKEIISAGTELDQII